MKEKLENILNDIEESLADTSIEFHECNSDYMECPICGAKADITYIEGRRQQSLSMGSIKHDDDCAHIKIKEAIKILDELRITS